MPPVSVSRFVALAVILAPAVAPAVVHAQVSGTTRTPGIQMRAIDSLAIVPVMRTAIVELQNEFPAGRVVLDRVVADTSKRLAPPVVSRREHVAPEEWVRREWVEAAPTELAAPECNILKTQCRLQGDIVGVIAFADPFIWGDSALVIARFNTNFGDPPTRVRTTVVELTLTRTEGQWKVRKQRIRATG